MNLINQVLDNQEKTIRSIFISSYIPKKCGIATFTKDLTSALNNLNPESLAEIIAIDGSESETYYPWEVKYKVPRNNLDGYYRAAEYVNQSSADVICLQHEYGLFGGDGGDYIFGLIRSINKPVVTTLHTVLENPDEIQRFCLSRVADFSEYLVVMTPTAKDRLERIYKIDPSKVVIIHHGVADEAKASKSKKSILGWSGKRVLLVSGLIHRDKGIEQIIRVLPGIVKEFPNTILVVAGQTHPEILKQDGEKYRNSLIRLAKKLKVKKNVKFVNKYLPLEKLLILYEACDIYLTTHTNPEQISSGTLAYALGMGKVCVSTPYAYAKEMLSEKRGILVDFGDEKQTSDAIVNVFSDPLLESRLSENAYLLGCKMRWPRVAQRYLNLFRVTKKINETNKLKAPQLLNR